MSIKKSKFLSQTTVEDTATFDFVINGANRKIPKSDLVTLFGTTGALQQEGDTGGTAVLHTVGTTHNIRNIEDGPGISSAVSPKGGVKLTNALLGDETAGANPLLVDKTTAPKILSLIPGVGISMARVDDKIQVTATGITVAANVVIVNTMSDFPAAVAGVITLADNTAYLVSANLTTSNRFEVITSGSAKIYGGSPLISSLTYSGSDAMFTGSLASFHLEDITIDCPSGDLFDFVGSGAEELHIQNVHVTSVDTIGVIHLMEEVYIWDSYFADIITDGASFGVGTFDILSVRFSEFYLNGGDAFDLQTAVFNHGVEFYANVCNITSGGYFIVGAISSANIAANSRGIVSGTRINGVSTWTSGIARNDIRWDFQLNDLGVNTTPGSRLTMTGNATPTTIAVASTPVRIAGTWANRRSDQTFTNNSSTGTITYYRESPRSYPVYASVTIEPVSGTNKKLRLSLYVNGSPVAGASISAVINAGTPKNLVVPITQYLQENDYLELFVSNETDTVNILVSDAIFMVN